MNYSGDLIATLAKSGSGVGPDALIRKLIEGIDDHVDPNAHHSRCALGARAERMPQDHRAEFSLGLGDACTCGLDGFLAFVENVRAGPDKER